MISRPSPDNLKPLQLSSTPGDSRRIALASIYLITGAIAWQTIQSLSLQIEACYSIARKLAEQQPSADDAVMKLAKPIDKKAVDFGVPTIVIIFFIFVIFYQWEVA